MSFTDRVIILAELRGIACSPLFDRPDTPDDQLRRDAFDRAQTLVYGCRIMHPRWKLVMHNDVPTIATDTHDPQPLYTPRGGR